MRRSIRRKTSRPYTPYHQQETNQSSNEDLLANPTRFLDLPEILIERIVMQLPAVSQIAISQTCKTLRVKMHEPIILEQFKNNHKLFPPIFDKHLTLYHDFLSRVHHGFLGRSARRNTMEAENHQLAKLYVQRILMARTSMNLRKGIFTTTELSANIYGYIHYLAFSSNGRKILFHSRSTKVHVVDITTQPPRWVTLEGHSYLVNCASFSPCGNRVVTTTNYGFLAKVWDLTNHPPTWIDLNWHREYLRSASFSSDGNRVILVTDGGRARIWNITHHPPTWVELKDHYKDISCFSFPPAGDQILTCSSKCLETQRWDNKVHLWDLATSPLKFVELGGHQKNILSATFSCMGDQVATTSTDRTARIWDFTSTPPICVELSGHQEFVISASFSPTENKIVTTSRHEPIRIWDIHANPPTYIELNEDYNPVSYALFSYDGKQVFTTNDGIRFPYTGHYTARIWDLSTNPPQSVPLHGHRLFNKVSIAPGGYRMATHRASTPIQIRDFSSDGDQLCQFLSAKNAQSHLSD